MSIVVCSNKRDNREYERFGEDQAPYRFRNHLKYGVEIPKNSEVAVQSVKINKDGLIKISDLSRFYQYLGINLRTTGATLDPKVEDIDESVGWCVRCNPDMFGKDYPEFVNLGEFATRMTRGMITGMPHPDLDTANTFCKIRTGNGDEVVGSGFTGFLFQYQFLPAEDYVLYTPASDWKKLTNANLNITDDGAITTITCSQQTDPNPNNNNVAWANKYPLSHIDGEVNFNTQSLMRNYQADPTTEGADYGYGGDFQLGLLRGIPGNDGDQSRLPGNNILTDQLSRNKQAFDYVINCERLLDAGGGNRFLSVGNMVCDETADADLDMPLHLKEIFYFNNSDRDDYNGGTHWRHQTEASGFIATNKSRYNMSTNIQRFDHFRIRIENERVNLQAMSSLGGDAGTANHPAVAGTYYNIASYAFVATHGAYIHNIPKPSGITTWNLYPKVAISQNGKSVDITQQSRDINAVQSNPDKDWYVRMVKNGELRYTLGIDTRYMYQTATSITNPIYPQQGTDETTGLNNYVPILIVGNGEPQYVPTNDANMASLLGFNSHSVLDDTYSYLNEGQQTQYLNDVQPDLLDYGSMFVRLDNFTQKSYNAGTGRPSKILYHMPRFDTSNRDIGSALYFEPHERSYIKFQNADKLVLNEFNISFCDNQERLVEDLVGQSIVVLHIRPSSSPLGKM